MSTVNDALFSLAKSYNANNNQKRSILEVYPLWLRLCPGNKSVLKWLADNTLHYTDDPWLQQGYIDEFLKLPNLSSEEILKYRLKRCTLCIQHCMYKTSDEYQENIEKFSMLCEEFLSSQAHEFPISYYFVPMIAKAQLACKVLYKIRPMPKVRELAGRSNSKRKIGIMWLPINSDPSFQCLKLFLSDLSRKEDLTIFFNEKDVLSLLSPADKKLLEDVEKKNCADLDDEATAKLVKNEEIDVLFNMYWNFKRGYGIFEENPAKIIINFQGFATPVCAPEVFTYTISDVYLRQKMIKADPSHMENLILMPMYHQINFPAARQPDKLIRVPDEFILGYMPRSTKLSSTSVIVMLRYLEQTENTRLHLFCNNKNLRAVSENLVSCGLLPRYSERVTIKYEPQRLEYLKRVGEVSMFLDTFGHWSMHSTALEVIWNWIPFVTMTGDTLFSHSEAILRSLDLEDLIFDDPSLMVKSLKEYSRKGSRDYVDLCHKLIQNCERVGLFDMDIRVGQFREAITAALEAEVVEDIVIS